MAIFVMPLVAPITSSSKTNRGGEAPAMPGTGEYGGSLLELMVRCLENKLINVQNRSNDYGYTFRS